MNSLNLLNKTFLENKKIIVRGDLDVPLKDGKVVDGARLDAMVETLDYLTLRNAKVILIGHLGRPDGKVVEELRLDPVVDYLTKKGKKIKKVNEIIGEESESAAASASPGEILVLENLRFDPREEANSEEFGKALANFGDIYINECFATSHRLHASFVQIPKFKPAYSGFRLEKELNSLKKVLEHADKPLVAILGGIKLETKLPIISKFLTVADYVLLGGKVGLAYEGDNNYKVIVPIDYIGPNNEDLGPKTVAMFKTIIKMGKTIIWNGPVGKFEDADYSQGTREIANAVVDSKAFSLVGGGDTITALDNFGLKGKISFVSMGGGAMLDFISDIKLPGLEALGFYE